VETRLDWQAVEQSCPACGVSFPVIRGSVYDNDAPVGLYLIALHGHAGDQPLAHLAIALLRPEGAPVAVSLQISVDEQQYRFSLVEWSTSPWRDEAYLGVQLSPELARQSSMKADFFHVADHVVMDLPQVREYLK
jgi:hypothetical protein